MLRIIVHIPGEPDRAFEVQESVLIGRSSGCDLQIVGRHVSKEHARITVEAGGATICDAGSTNGVEVNGVNIEGEHLLRGGDEIVLGDAWLTIDPDSPLLVGRPRAPVTFEQLTARQRIMEEHSRREEAAYQRRNAERRTGDAPVEPRTEAAASTAACASRLVGRPVVRPGGEEPVLRVLRIAGPKGPREVYRLAPFLLALDGGEEVWIWPRAGLAPIEDRRGFEELAGSRESEPEQAQGQLLERQVFRLPERIAVLGASAHGSADDGRPIFSERAPGRPLQILALRGG